MDIKTVDLAEIYGLKGTAPFTSYLHKATGEMERYGSVKHDALIVVPGGGYGFVSEREGEEVALEYFTRNYNTFVLYYGIAPDYRYPAALMQLAAAVDYVKTHADELHIDKNRIFVMGFSAGGHLTGCLANLYDNLPETVPSGKKLDARPAGVVLSYPVIFPDSHIGSFKNLFGSDKADDPRYDALTLDKLVSPVHPPCFIWTTAEDTCVDPMATARYIAALIKNKIVFESHIFPYGWHGSTLGDERVHSPQDAKVFERSRVWADLADKFMKGLKTEQ